MRADRVRAVGEWLRSVIAVPFVVVGGSAVERTVPVGTKDVDVLISHADWSAVDTALEHRRDASPLDPSTGTIRATIVNIGDSSIDLEFISDAPFCGRRPPEAFGEYVREKGSTVHEGILYAIPEVVFYMRLSTDDWKAYVPSIERDILAGVPESTLDAAVKIAAHFGVDQTMQQRVAAVREILAS